MSKFTNTADTPVDLESEDQANMNTNTIGDKRPLAKVYRRPDNKVIKATAGRNIKTLVVCDQLHYFLVVLLIYKLI